MEVQFNPTLSGCFLNYLLGVDLLEQVVIMIISSF